MTLLLSLLLLAANAGSEVSWSNCARFEMPLAPHGYTTFHMMVQTQDAESIRQRCYFHPGTAESTAAAYWVRSLPPEGRIPTTACNSTRPRYDPENGAGAFLAFSHAIVIPKECSAFLERIQNVSSLSNGTSVGWCMSLGRHAHAPWFCRTRYTVSTQPPRTFVTEGTYNPWDRAESSTWSVLLDEKGQAGFEHTVEISECAGDVMQRSCVLITLVVPPPLYV